MSKQGLGDPDIREGQEAETLVPPFIRGIVTEVRQGRFETEVSVLRYGAISPVIVGARDVRRRGHLTYSDKGTIQPLAVEGD